MSIHDQLYEKMSEEYDRFLEELKGKPPGAIVDKAYEKVWKEEILMFFENDDFVDEDDAVILLGLANPLEELYKGWQDTDCDYLDHLRDSITSTIHEVLENPEWYAKTADISAVSTSKTIYGEVQPGDWVIAAGNNEYRYLIGTVTEITKLGTPEHAAETDNDTDNIHVDFTAFEYSLTRIAEIKIQFSSRIGEIPIFDEIPLDDVIMAPDMLIRITHLGQDEIERMGNLLKNCKSFCNCFPGGGEAPSKKHAELITRLNQNLNDYHNHIDGFGSRELIDMADKIAAMANAHLYMTGCDFFDSEVDFYLQFQNPLEVVADTFCERYLDIDDMSVVVNDIYYKKDGLDYYPLMSDINTLPNQEQNEAPLSHTDNSMRSEKSEQPSAKPKTFAEKLQAAQEKVKAQDAQGNKNKINKRDERD